jgi:hypothetical protein
VSDPEAERGASHEAKATESSQIPLQVPDGPPRGDLIGAEVRKNPRWRKLQSAPIWIEAFAAIALVVITAFYTHYASIQADQATTAASAAKTASETAAKQLEMSERPWMAAYFSVKEPLQ